MHLRSPHVGFGDRKLIQVGVSAAARSDAKLKTSVAVIKAACLYSERALRTASASKSSMSKAIWVRTATSLSNHLPVSSRTANDKVRMKSVLIREPFLSLRTRGGAVTIGCFKSGPCVSTTCSRNGNTFSSGRVLIVLVKPPFCEWPFLGRLVLKHRAFFCNEDILDKGDWFTWTSGGVVLFRIPTNGAPYFVCTAIL